MPQSYTTFLSTSSSLPPDRSDIFDHKNHIHVPPHVILDCPAYTVDDRFGTCFRLKEVEGEWGRERIGGGGVTKGDVLGIGVVLGMVVVAWAVVGILGWVLGRRRGRRDREGRGWKRRKGEKGGRRGGMWRAMEEGGVRGVVVGAGGDIFVVKS
ncbi:hypothetical protein VE01_00830 [Pseudogymnoascus verrucosus]|uniref:Uncharacterized protein n=1 Tax=Pseudogymnoascus verrucosus TaxID=342668 RepID=A0A2P2SVL8_9PEZI|nr:uncharacterized protein VE01_00830 [Pseudogymnoascus verrucosus]OBU00884.1 hypothetical protein VE01_00830 [Pseudogymnoascus verrucosus]